MERLSRFLADHRRVLAAVLAGLAMFAALTALTSEPDSRVVLVAARDLPSGHVLEDADVRPVSMPEAVAVGTVEQPVGRMSAGAMRSGEPLTDRRVVDPRALPDGRVLASIAVERSGAEFVRPGDTVDVLAVRDAHDAAAEPLVSGAEVLVVQEREGTEVTTLGLVVEPETARAVAAAAATSRFAVTHALSS
ncbi:Flp pilus assembly protein CpaB [Aeromicrobium phragmitis]|uniref:Flp pilus assembly protein CpaB n=1 Tax=Aeromicrobium phragmitis TaxID=2478914 RepID=A0A3L8PKI8_9ACTN|nr:SAF domain-containing protein [Aeromicrobium phragmitis]RLV55108.1 Flp pilus assembly protein CpaB [Aeromicrobium phragmitis]